MLCAVLCAVCVLVLYAVCCVLCGLHVCVCVLYVLYVLCYLRAMCMSV